MGQGVLNCELFAGRYKYPDVRKRLVNPLLILTREPPPHRVRGYSIPAIACEIALFLWPRAHSLEPILEAPPLRRQGPSQWFKHVQQRLLKVNVSRQSMESLAPNCMECPHAQYRRRRNLFTLFSAPDTLTRKVIICLLTP